MENLAILDITCYKYFFNGSDIGLISTKLRVVITVYSAFKTP